MSNPVCSGASINTQCYITPGAISEKQQQALKVYAKVLQLAAIGGTDYTNSLVSTLLTDAATLGCGMDLANREASRVHLEFAKATAAGASVPSTINAKIAKILCLTEVDPQALDEADLLLTCKLGRAKAYPQ